jgi:hypothetical protein
VLGGMWGREMTVLAVDKHCHYFQYYSQQAGSEINLSVQQQMNSKGKCGGCSQLNITHP